MWQRQRLELCVSSGKNLVTLGEKMTRDLVIVIGFRFLNSKREQIGIGLEELLKAKYVDCHQERIPLPEP